MGGEHEEETKSNKEAIIAYEKDALNVTEAISAVAAAIKHLKASKEQLKGAKLDGGFKGDFMQLYSAAKSGQLVAEIQAATAKNSGNQKPAAYAYNSNEIIA